MKRGWKKEVVSFGILGYSMSTCEKCYLQLNEDLKNKSCVKNKNVKIWQIKNYVMLLVV